MANAGFSIGPLSAPSSFAPAGGVWGELGQAIGNAPVEMADTQAKIAKDQEVGQDYATKGLQRLVQIGYSNPAARSNPAWSTQVAQFARQLNIPIQHTPEGLIDINSLGMGPWATASLADQKEAYGLPRAVRAAQYPDAPQAVLDADPLAAMNPQMMEGIRNDLFKAVTAFGEGNLSPELFQAAIQSARGAGVSEAEIAPYLDPAFLSAHLAPKVQAEIQLMQANGYKARDWGPIQEALMQMHMNQFNIREGDLNQFRSAEEQKWAADSQRASASLQANQLRLQMDLQKFQQANQLMAITVGQKRNEAYNTMAKPLVDEYHKAIAERSQVHNQIQAIVSNPLTMGNKKGIDGLNKQESELSETINNLKPTVDNITRMQMHLNQATAQAITGQKTASVGNQQPPPPKNPSGMVNFGGQQVKIGTRVQNRTTKQWGTIGPDGKVIPDA